MIELTELDNELGMFNFENLKKFLFKIKIITIYKNGELLIS